MHTAIFSDFLRQQPSAIGTVEGGDWDVLNNIVIPDSPDIAPERHPGLARAVLAALHGLLVLPAGDLELHNQYPWIGIPTIDGVFVYNNGLPMLSIHADERIPTSPVYIHRRKQPSASHHLTHARKGTLAAFFVSSLVRNVPQPLNT